MVEMESNRAQDVKLFTTPIHAMVDGEHPVRLIATGDVPGHSPCYLTVDENGRSQWESFDHVQIIDTNYLPISREALRTAQTATTGSRTHSR